MLLLHVYFFTPFFILMLLLYFCLLVDHENTPIIFVFRAFVYPSNNTISIFVTISYGFEDNIYKKLFDDIGICRQLNINASTLFKFIIFVYEA